MDIDMDKNFAFQLPSIYSLNLRGVNVIMTYTSYHIITAISITAPRLRNDGLGYTRLISLAPGAFHSKTKMSFLQKFLSIMIHLIIHASNLNDAHLNSYSVSSDFLGIGPELRAYHGLLL